MLVPAFDALLSLLHADVEIDESPQFAETGTYHGHAGTKRLHALFTEQFDPFGMRLEDVIDAGDEAVACLRVGGVARASRMEIFVPTSHVLTFVRGRLNARRSSWLATKPSKPWGRRSRTTLTTYLRTPAAAAPA